MSPVALSLLAVSHEPWRLALQAGNGGFEVPRLPVLVVVTLAGFAMVYMGARQLRDPEWSAGKSAQYRAKREGIAVEEVEPTAEAVERARRGGYVLLALGIVFLLLAATQVPGLRFSS